MRAKEQDTNRADRGVKSSPPIQEAIWSATQMTIIGFLVNTSCYPTATYLCTHHILQIDTSDIFFSTCNVILFYTYSVEHSGSQ